MKTTNTGSGVGRLAVAGLGLLALACPAGAQTLRFSNHRDVKVPEYALLRLGPFYSNVGFTQSAGYRYTRSSGTGTDFLTENRRGKIKEDGQEFPLVTTLNFRNYLILTPSADIDASVRLSYAHYPLKTQDNEFNVDLAEEGIVGDLSMEFAPTPFLKGTVYDRALYKTDYVDTRGINDEYGGKQFVYFSNELGVNMDWLMRPDRNLALSVSRSDLLPADDEFEEQENVAYSESLAYQQRLNPFVAAGLGARFSQNDYRATNRLDSTIQQYYVHGNAQLTRDTRMAAEVGYSIASLANPPQGMDAGDSDVSTAVGSLGIQSQLSPEWSHSLTAARAMRTGFESAVETADSAAYRLQWKGVFASAGFFSAYSVVDPSSEEVGGYSNWANGLDATYPLCSFANLEFSTGYDQRRNESPSREGASVDPEQANDYSTWTSRIGTSFAVMEHLGFSTYFQHIERRSSSDSLAYERDIFAADLAYSYEF